MSVFFLRGGGRSKSEFFPFLLPLPPPKLLAEIPAASAAIAGTDASNEGEEA